MTEHEQVEAVSADTTQGSENEKPPTIPLEKLAIAEEVIGLSFTDAERELMAENVTEHRGYYEKLRAVHIENDVPPAFSFDPRLPGMSFDTERKPLVMSYEPLPPLPADREEIAFWPIAQLAELIRTRQVSSVALTEMYLKRLKRYDPILHCVVTLTEELALAQAKRADAEVAKGKYRGPLHGIPWGAKDLLATKGIRTTWGAEPYRDQVIDLDATVVERLDAAGAVLVAKLSLGALAWGDVWIDGQLTRNPWNTDEGSSGSSAGSASAVIAGLVGFSIGTETLGSIVSPSTQCRATGLRPTFGRVSRYGAMSLCPTLDKIGPICRTVEDCALVFDAICGPDGKDLTVTDYPFNWDATLNIHDLRIGYLADAYEADKDNKALNDKSLDVLKSLGINLIAVKLPDYPVDEMNIMVEVEAAATFDELTRSNRDDMLYRQVKDAWPNVFRLSRLVPAVEYLQANRIRTLIMRELGELFKRIDVYVTPSFGISNLRLTNYSGHPAVVAPNGVNKTGKPSSITFMGNLYGEAKALAVAKVYQDATEFHKQHPAIAPVA